jgi:hypothetical protein
MLSASRTTTMTAKGRCARYEIVDEIDKDKADEAFAKSVQEAAEQEASTLTPEKLVEALNQLIASQK